MKDKCEWKDGEFEPCDTSGQLLPYEGYKHNGFYLPTNIHHYIFYFCPFCGASLKKPEETTK